MGAGTADFVVFDEGHALTSLHCLNSSALTRWARSDHHKIIAHVHEFLLMVVMATGAVHVSMSLFFFCGLADIYEFHVEV